MNHLSFSCLLLLPVMYLSQTLGAQENGLASAFKGDLGISKHAEVLFFEDFEKAESPFMSGDRGIVETDSLVPGKHVLASYSKQGKHTPWDMHAEIAKTDIIFYRFYTKFDASYDVGGGIKGPGVSANAQGKPGGKAGIKPQGNDSFSARVCFNSKAEPYVYYYHMDMGQWGSNANQNIGSPISMQAGQWYCIEMMLKPNTPTAKDGELKMWVNGELKMHKTDIRWRTTADLQLNWINHSAYFGGDWTSPKDQTRFEDNMIAARSYIGPAGARSSTPTDNEESERSTRKKRSTQKKED